MSVDSPPAMLCVACPARMETVIDGAWLCRRCADLYPEVIRYGPEIAARLREGGQ